MNAPFNSLTRGSRYTFVFGAGLDAVTGVFHEILPDGLLLVAGRKTGTRAAASEFRLNPALVVYAREA